MNCGSLIYHLSLPMCVSYPHQRNLGSSQTQMYPACIVLLLLVIDSVQAWLVSNKHIVVRSWSSVILHILQPHWRSNFDLYTIWSVILHVFKVIHHHWDRCDCTTNISKVNELCLCILLSISKNTSSSPDENIMYDVRWDFRGVPILTFFCQPI